MMTITGQARWYPSPPPALDGESTDAYTDRLTGADHTGRRPYNHPRGRQCSIGYHMECTGWRGASSCECPCHLDKHPGDIQHLPALVLDAAQVLAPLYDLPRQTGLRVMALARDAAAGDDTPNRIVLTAALERAYASPQSQDFVTDVMSIYAAAAAGTLAGGGIPGGS
jgi:hypothetical protein